MSTRTPDLLAAADAAARSADHHEGVAAAHLRSRAPDADRLRRATGSAWAARADQLECQALLRQAGTGGGHPPQPQPDDPWWPRATEQAVSS